MSETENNNIQFNVVINRHEKENGEIIEKVPEEIILEPGEIMFVVGKNGSGKTKLLEYIASKQNKCAQLNKYAKLVFTNNNIRGTKDFLMQDRNYVIKEQKQVIVDLFKDCNLNIEPMLLRDDNDMQFSRVPNAYPMSDGSTGEQIILYMFFNIIMYSTMNSVILIDEIEQSLYRGIIVPLLKTLLKIRSDLTYIITTHHLDLLSYFSDSKLLILKDYEADNESWIYNYYPEEMLDKEGYKIDFPEDVKLAIFGDKRKVLFCEGEGSGSLDKRLYEILYPEYEVIPVGDCKYVKETVKKLNKALENKVIDWLEVKGIIDRDTRTDDEINKLIEKGVHVLPVYAVESVYYHPVAIKKICERNNADYNHVMERALNELRDKEDRRFASRVDQEVQRVIKNAMKDEEKMKGDIFSVEINYSDKLDREKEMFSEILSDNADNPEKSYEYLITRYNIKKSADLFSIIADACGWERGTREDYERELLDLAKSDTEFRKELKKIVGFEPSNTNSSQ